MDLKKVIVTSVVSGLMLGCATGSTPADKKKNAISETSEALQQIYEDHPAAKAQLSKSLAYLICTGSDSYLLAASSGGGVCVLNTKGNKEFYRFASLGVGAGIGFDAVCLLSIDSAVTSC